MGTIVNVLLILFGSFIGLTAKRFINETLQQTIMKIMGLCVLVIGIQGAIKSTNIIIVIISLVFGTIIGELVNLDGLIIEFAKLIEKKFFKNEGVFVQGFVNASCLYVIGAMAIVGSIQSGLGNHDVLYAKGLLDGIASVFLSGLYGIGVAFSALPVLLYQGVITLLAIQIAPFMSDILINEITAVGSILIIAISFNMLDVIKIKVANALFSIPIVIIIMIFFNF